MDPEDGYLPGGEENSLGRNVSRSREASLAMQSPLISWTQEEAQPEKGQGREGLFQWDAQDRGAGFRSKGRQSITNVHCLLQQDRVGELAQWLGVITAYGDLDGNVLQRLMYLNTTSWW